MKRLLLLLAASTCALGLAGCADSSVTKSIDKMPVLAPVSALTHQQAMDYFGQVQKGIAAADQKRDVDLLKQIAVNPALNMRSTQYKLISATSVPSLSFVSDSYTPTTSVKWPRDMVVVTDAQDSGAATLMLLQQPSPRDIYKLVSWARIFPGQRIETARTELGSKVVAANAKGFISTPQQALKDYAAVVGSNELSKDKKIPTDRLMTYLNTQNSGWQTTLGASVSLKWDVSAGNIQSVIVGPDKRAMVFGTITATTTLEKALPRARINITGPYGALLGSNTRINKKVALTSLCTVVLILPPEGSMDQIHAIAAEVVPLSAVAQD